MRSLVSTLFILIAGLVAPVLATAAAAQQTPLAILRERDTEVRSFLKKNPLPLNPQKRAEIENILNELFDYEYIALESLGKNREGPSQAKLKEYIDVFTRVTRRNASSQESLKTLLEGEISYEGESKDKKSGDTIVNTLIIKNDEEIMMDYVFRKKGDEWRIVDYVLDDVGLIENYKSSFSQIIADHGFDDLIRRLREKLDS